MSRPEARPSCDPSLPWAASRMPALRSGPPYLMAEAIEREPALAERIALDAAASGKAAALAELLRSAGDTSAWPPAVVGCGTSEHGAMAAAAIWSGTWQRLGLPGPGPVARQGLEAALAPWPGVSIGVSHEGGTRATMDALVAARAGGARLGLITAGANSPAASLVDVCLCTPEVDLSWCHTIGYLSPVVAAAAVAAALEDVLLEAVTVRQLAQAGLDASESARALAREIASSRMLVVTASGADRISAREMTLKVEEASYVPTRYRDLETLLHGHIPSMDVGTSLVLILADRERRPARVARALEVLAAVARVGVRCGAILAEQAAEAIPAALTPAGRVVVPESPGLPPPVAALVGTAVPLQLVTYHLALALGTNPDALRREVRAYRSAAEVAESSG